MLGVGHAASALEVQAVRFGVHPDKTRMVLELDRPAGYRVFLLENPYRMVIDMPVFNWQAHQIQAPKGGPVTSVRSGLLEPGISRVVVDLTGPVAIKSVFTLPASARDPDRLVIDFMPASASSFSANKDKVFGRLETSGMRSPPSVTSSSVPVISAPAPSANQTPVVTPARKPVTERPLVVIDAGHGGQDPGAIGNHRGMSRVYEKNVTLAAAKELKSQLEATGRYRAQLTRSGDKFIKLYDRVKIAHNAGADLFISLHADSIDNDDVRGASIYTLSNTASDAQTAKLAARENKVDLIGGVDLSHEDKDVANILIDLAMRDTMNQSKFFANTVVSKFQARGVRILPKTHRYAGFAVLKGPDVPSVLIEMGFMSNKSEVQALTSDSYRQKLAATLVEGIDAYFTRVQNNNRN